jgi:glutamate dehydrogenase (NAD(P)+)
MVQNSYAYFWEESQVHQQLDAKITRAYHTVQKAVEEKRVRPRLAAMVVGIARVAEACKLRGWV